LSVTIFACRRRTITASIVQKPSEYFNIIHLQDPAFLEEFLGEPLTFIAETVTGALGTGGKGLMVAGGRLVQALMKGRLFQQWAAEFYALRDTPVWICSEQSTQMD
jgi:hypothetical protein